MLTASNPDRIDIAFDDDRLVDHAGLLLPATLAAGSASASSPSAISTSVMRRAGRTWATSC